MWSRWMSPWSMESRQWFEKWWVVLAWVRRSASLRCALSAKQWDAASTMSCVSLFAVLFSGWHCIRRSFLCWRPRCKQRLVSQEANVGHWFSLAAQECRWWLTLLDNVQNGTICFGNYLLGLAVATTRTPPTCSASPVVLSVLFVILVSYMQSLLDLNKSSPMIPFFHLV